MKSADSQISKLRNEAREHLQHADCDLEGADCARKLRSPDRTVEA